MDLELIIVPYDVGQDDTPMARAPQELLARGFDAALEAAGFDLVTTPVWSRGGRSRQAVVSSVARATARAVTRARSRRRYPLVLSGGCLTALGVVAGLQRPATPLGIVWVDAHGDFNTPEISPSGYWDGMALAAVCGRSLEPLYRQAEVHPIGYRRIAHLGGRAFDPPELEDFERLKVLLVPPDRVADDDSVEAIRQVVAGTRQLYLHVDLDGLDPADAPAVHMPEPGGIRLDAFLACLERLPPPTAMTLSGMSFEQADGAQARRTVKTCLRVVQAATARPAAAR